ncbi:MAG TPA: HTH domain-containing protein, partial [Rhodospirillales bacterium]|nr:HTH domain-containing protein [Rhodospirillales bacterium]
MNGGLHPRTAALVRALADGRFRSGTELARVLGISRTAVWKHVERLAALGLEVHAVRGKGYRLARPLDLLDADAVRAAMPPSAAARLGTLAVHDLVDST